MLPLKLIRRGVIAPVLGSWRRRPRLSKRQYPPSARGGTGDDSLTITDIGDGKGAARGGCYNACTGHPAHAA